MVDTGAAQSSAGGAAHLPAAGGQHAPPHHRLPERDVGLVLREVGGAVDLQGHPRVGQGQVDAEEAVLHDALHFKGHAQRGEGVAHLALRAAHARVLRVRAPVRLRLQQQVGGGAVRDRPKLQGGRRGVAAAAESSQACLGCIISLGSFTPLGGCRCMLLKARPNHQSAAAPSKHEAMGQPGERPVGFYLLRSEGNLSLVDLEVRLLAELRARQAGEAG